mgnify:CR=1 FL=1
MSKIAIDAVLLPPEEIMGLCIKLNIECNAAGKAKGQLGKKDFVPHLTLAIGAVQEKDLPAIFNILDKMAKNWMPLSLEIYQLKHYISKTDGEKSYSFKIKLTEKLQQLHEIVMKSLEPYFSDKLITVEMLYKDQGEIIEKVSPAVTEYKEKYSFSNFDPHITLLCHETKYDGLPMEFISSTLAVFHLGINGTCRKRLFSTELKQKNQTV